MSTVPSQVCLACGRPVRELGTSAHPECANPRYLAYCAAEGVPGDPEATLALDADRYPGGKMCGFILWISARWEEWAARRGLRGDWRWNNFFLGRAEHLDFDDWLRAWTRSR